VELAEGSRVHDLVRALGAPAQLVYALLVDDSPVGLDHALEDGAVVTLMPPFAGGAGSSMHGGSDVAGTRAKVH
jgi:sulfur carrier protein ThiS